MSRNIFRAVASQSGFRPLLPNEPRILHASTQANLTAKFLLPALPEVEIFFLAVRAMVDPVQQNKLPRKLGKLYPIGQCLEITIAVQRLLRKVDAAQLNPAAARGYAAFSAFLRAGGAFRQVWGDLRGEFFQNAFQLGTLYVDVSNDTVTPTKPKVEILPFADARLTAIADFRHFRKLAGRYWQDNIFPNHVLPELAPYCPLVHVSRNGLVLLRENSEYMIALAQAGQFECSEEILADPPMPAEVFDHVSNTLAKTRLKLPLTPADGRAQALRLCREYHSKRWHASDTQTRKVRAAIHEANSHLITAPASPALYKNKHAPDTGMPSANASHHPRYIPVNTTAHAHKSWRRLNRYHFAAHDVLIPLAIHELPKALLALPIGIVDMGRGFVPVAVQGLAGRNMFVAADGCWLAQYLPEAYRHYPFALEKADDGRQLLCIDQNGGLLDGDLSAGDLRDGSSQVERLFNDDGTLASPVREVMTLLSQAQVNAEATARSCALLHQYQLLKPWRIQIQNGQHLSTFENVYCVDEAALTQASADLLKELQVCNALTLAYCQLLSMQNIHLLGNTA